MNDRELLVHIRDLIDAQLGTLAHTETDPSVLPPIDYNDPAYNVAPYELMAGINRPVNWRNGKPVNWDWEKWAAATGRPNPEVTPDVDGESPMRSGTYLESPGQRRENLHTPGNPITYTFTLPDQRIVELVVGAMPGRGYFHEVTEHLDGEAPEKHEALQSHYVRQVLLSAGTHTWTIDVDNAAWCGVLYN